MLEKANIYLIGIGGIGMSALARYFKSIGKNVAGYDRTSTLLSQELEKEGIDIHYEDSLQLIDKVFLDPKNTTVIYTPAIPVDHRELTHFKNNGFDLLKRARALGEISRKYTCLAVAGTHGKTTTSTLLAHLFKNAGKEAISFLGGIAVNYNTNFLPGNDSDLFIAEADEYDRSFLQLHPNGGIITSVDSDHLDIYGDENSLKATFREFAESISGPRIVHPRTGLVGLTYSLSEDTDFKAENIRVEEHAYVFDIVSPDNRISDIHSGLPGRHNVENAIAAAALALQFGLSPEEVRNGISSFKGVKRRFEYHIQRDDLVYIDDYAHHPKEIEALLSSVRELYPNKKILGIFQPHLYSRTRDFMDGFAEALSKLDHLILMDIYPAREKPIPGIRSKVLLQKAQNKHKELLSTQEILTNINDYNPEVVLTIGAGDIDKIVNPLKLKLLQ